MDFDEDEKYIDSFYCAWEDSIQLVGRMYVTSQKLIFKSHFNGRNIFFDDTILKIPLRDIIKIEKKKNAIIFDNSLLITTIKANLFFASFVYRDKAYTLIHNQLEH